MPQTKQKILVADHDLDTLSKIYIDLLLNHFIVEVTNDALEIVDRAHRFQPDMLILNGDLPNLDANEICKLIKENKKIPIILLVEKHSDKSAAIDGCAADEIHAKPVDVTTLYLLIDKLLTATQE